MKKLFSIIVVGFLLGACATPQRTTEAPQPKAAQGEPAQQTKPEPKKEKTIVIRISRLVKETSFFPDGTLDEIRIYQYSQDGKNLLREELTDSASKDLLETVQYSYKNSALAERVSFDKEKKLKGKKTFTYLTSGLLESEAFFDKKEALQAVSKFAYDSAGNKVEWTTLDSAGVALATTKYGYQSGKLVKITLLGPTGKVDLDINVIYDDKGNRSRETYTDGSGKTEKEILYTYDAKNRLTSEATLTATKAVLNKTVYEYAGDAEEPSKAVYLDAREKTIKSIQFERAYREEKKTIYE